MFLLLISIIIKYTPPENFCKRILEEIFKISGFKALGWDVHTAFGL